ncbi:glycosyltransferase family 2 protein [Mesorhizobium australicum]|nr:glycosyltransferase family 2 protein [Mesorhizobium australicum]
MNITDETVNRPAISIIVCAYNEQKHIRETLDSLIGQTYSNLEILVIDDASTDLTPQICRDYTTRDARVRVITHSENRGLAHGRKTGVAEARHELLTFIDADDIAMPDMIERLVAVLLADGDCLGVSAYRIYFDDERDLGVQKIGPTSRDDYRRLYDGRKLIFLSYPNLVRKADVLAVGGYRVNIMPNNDGIRFEDFCEDLDLWCRMSDLSADGRFFITLEEPLSRYRKPAGSMSTANVKIMQDKMRWIKDCLRRRRAAQPERCLADFLASRTAFDRFSDWRADTAAGFYKKAGFAYSKRNYLKFAWYVALTATMSPKLILQKLATQSANL